MNIIQPSIIMNWANINIYSSDTIYKLILSLIVLIVLGSIALYMKTE